MTETIIPTMRPEMVSAHDRQLAAARHEIARVTAQREEWAVLAIYLARVLLTNGQAMLVDGNVAVPVEEAREIVRKYQVGLGHASVRPEGAAEDVEARDVVVLAIKEKPAPSLIHLPGGA